MKQKWKFSFVFDEIDWLNEMNCVACPFKLRWALLCGLLVIGFRPIQHSSHSIQSIPFIQLNSKTIKFTHQIKKKVKNSWRRNEWEKNEVGLGASANNPLFRNLKFFEFQWRKQPNLLHSFHSFRKLNCWIALLSLPPAAPQSFNLLISWKQKRRKHCWLEEERRRQPTHAHCLHCAALFHSNE